MNESSNAAPQQAFYVIGGTLRYDAPSYVERQADKDLHAALQRGEFCYVLTPRQLGKSSLMVRTVRRLRQEGAAVAVLDLTAIGQNLTVEQWYEGLVGRLGQQFDLEDELEEFWLVTQRLSPVQRFFKALCEVVLAQRPGPVAIFVDEIDAVRSLPFATDEFFAAVRECYNRRAEDPRFNQLTFCLLGVATPSDLIRDPRTTPFNIGRRIELKDFTEAEAQGLAEGFRKGRADAQVSEVLGRIFHWTHGHPYLTQRLCKAVAEDVSVTSAAGVDGLCEGLFLSDRARERDDNLIFVRERLLRAEVDRMSLLDLYWQVLRGRRVPDDPTNRLVSILRLSGITRVEHGCLVVRMRIYQRVFDRKWVLANMPDAEVRRQREAYRQGILRTAAVAVLVVAMMAALARYGFQQAELARFNAQEEILQRKRAENARGQLAETLSQMEVHQAEVFFREDRSSVGVAYLAHVLRSNPSNHVAAERLLAALTQRSFALPVSDVPRRERPDRPARFDRPDRAPPPRVDATEQRELEVRGEAVFIKNRAGEPLTEQPLRHEGRINSALFSPDGQRVVTASRDNTARVWDVITGQPITPPLRHAGAVESAEFDPNGLQVVTAAGDRTARIWDAYSGQPLSEPLKHSTFVGWAQFSRDGQWVITFSPRSRSSRTWDVRPGESLAEPLRHGQAITSVQFSRDGERLVTASKDRTARVWDTRTGLPRTPPLRHEREVNAAQFSPDGRLVATACADHAARLWDAATGKAATNAPMLHDRAVTMLEFNPDGSRLVSGSQEDRTARLWDVTTGQPVGEPFRHDSPLTVARFSADGLMLVTATAAENGEARIWEVATGHLISGPMRHSGPVVSAQFDPAGRRLVTAAMESKASTDNTARIWDVQTGQPLTEPLNHNSIVNSARFSLDGRWVITASTDRTARVWDAQNGQPFGGPLLHDAAVVYAQFFADGQHILTSCSDRSARIWDASSSQPLSEPLTQERSSRFAQFGFMEQSTTDLSHNGHWLATATSGGDAFVWEVLSLSLPVPDWLPELAESVAGDRINQRGLIESPSARDYSELKRKLLSSKAADFYARWARWFLENRWERHLSPASAITVKEYTQRRIEEDTLVGLQEAVRICPTNAVALARLARWMIQDAPTNSSLPAAAVFLSSRAAELAPDTAEVWRLRAEVTDQAGQTPAALEASERAVRLAADDAEAWNVRGLVLGRSKRLDEAEAAFTCAIGLAEKQKKHEAKKRYQENRKSLWERRVNAPINENDRK